MWSQIKKDILNNCSKNKKDLIVLWICLILIAIYYHFGPYILGSQIDREFLESLDTEELTVWCSDAEIYYPDKEKDAQTALFSTWGYENIDVLIRVDMYNENIYGKTAKVRHRWNSGGKLFEFDTVITMQKNNVKITIYDYNKDMRSRDAEIFLKEVFTELGV